MKRQKWDHILLRHPINPLTPCGYGIQRLGDTLETASTAVLTGLPHLPRTTEAQHRRGSANCGRAVLAGRSAQVRVPQAWHRGHWVGGRQLMKRNEDFPGCSGASGAQWLRTVK